jgi:nucleotide-binding universal stress UspA family protein
MFANVVLPIDLNHPASWEKALPMAVKLCGKEGTLHVLGIVPDLGAAIISTYLPDGFEKKALQQMKDELDAFCARILPEGVKVQAHVGHGHVPEHVITSAKKVGADLIVIASHPPEDLKTLLVGSYAGKVVRHSPVPVLVVR